MTPALIIAAFVVGLDIESWAVCLAPGLFLLVLLLVALALTHRP